MNDLMAWFVRPALLVCGFGAPFALFGAFHWLLRLAEKWLDDRRCHGEILDLRRENQELKWKIGDMASGNNASQFSTHLSPAMLDRVRRP